MPIQSTPLPVSSAANLYTIGPASSPGPPTSSSGSTERALPTSKAPPNEPPQAKLIGVSRRPLSPKAIRKVRGPSDKVLEGIGVARGSSLLPCRVGKELSQNIAGLRKPAEPSTDILAKSEETIAVAYAAVHGEVWTAKRPAEEELMQVSQVKKASNMRARRIRAPTRRSERKKV